MKKIFRAAAVVFGALLLFSAVCFAEKLDFSDADFVFVDARGTTGYYVDMNSVNIVNDYEADARVELVKADQNKMFIYSVHFDKQKRTYQILDSLIAKYDTKEKTGGSMNPMKPGNYVAGSPMESVVEYIYHPQP